METGVIVSLAAYFIAMLGIGLWAWKKSTDDIDGYLLGGRNLSPQVAALSAGASDMSGWLLLGLPGAAFGDPGEIGLHRLHANSLSAQSIGRSAYCRLVCNYHEVRAETRQFLADTAGCAGYHGEFSVLHFGLHL